MSRLLPHPDIDWTGEGLPVARAADDVYYSAEDGLAETRTVFLKGCGLPEAWAGREHFTIAETGFGTGLNFLAALGLWRETRPSATARLSFVSFEGYPLRLGDAARALGRWDELAGLAAPLLAGWPDPVRGVRRIVFRELGAELILHLGDIAETLPQSRFKADAWFLDGFSPAKNPAMWADGIYPALAQRSVPGARLATFTVAGPVRRGLEAAGFSVARVEGHGRKRHRLEARFADGALPTEPDTHGLRPPETACRRVAVLGAGIAGAAAARAMMEVGLAVTVFDPAPAVASGASGNPLALLMPRLDAGDTAEARLLIDAYLAARELYAGLPGAEQAEVLQRPRNAAERQRFEKILSDPPLPAADLLAGDDGGLVHRRALILRPREVIAALLAQADVRLGHPVDLDTENLAVNGEAFDAIVLANGMAAAGPSPWLPLEAKQGQVEFVETRVQVAPSALASGSYAIASGAERLWGATFEAVAGGALPRESDGARAENQRAVGRLDPDWIADIDGFQPISRAAIRATTPDRLPLIGALPDLGVARAVFSALPRGRAVATDAPLVQGIYLATGYGARGFTWAPWAASVLAAQLTARPVPAGLAAIRAVSPMRFVLREFKRKG